MMRYFLFGLLFVTIGGAIGIIFVSIGLPFIFNVQKKTRKLLMILLKTVQ